MHRITLKSIGREGTGKTLVLKKIALLLERSGIKGITWEDEDNSLSFNAPSKKVLTRLLIN